LPLASLGTATSCRVRPVTMLAADGPTVTEATGAGGGVVTVMVEVPFLPSLVAVIVADPAAAPATSPLPFTAATLVFELPHVTVRPVNAPPLASLGVAVNCTVCPTWMPADGGVTLTDATGTGALVTVMEDEPLCPSLVAVIVADPTAAPVTRPLGLTPATVALSLVQATARPPSAVPFASRGVAVNCTV